MKFFAKLIKVLLILIAILTLVVGLSIYWEIFHWRSSTAAEVEIEKGSSLNAIAELLYDKSVIRSPGIFSGYARIKGVSGKLSAGEYEFPANMTLNAILDKIVRGEVKQYRLTIIEGWNLEDIKNSLAQKIFLEPYIAADFEKLVYDTSFINTLGLGGLTSLEGYLFPDTYNYNKPRTAQEIISPMVKRFKEIYTDEFKLRAKELGMTDEEVITLASIIEKETGDDEERPLISSVFHNRLEKGMVLASDPTVIYGIPNFDGNLRKADLKRPSPYNTYVNPGLPPGPICNPGLASIKAALYPAISDYLYFVSKNNGSHHFSKTIEEHSKAVIQYQKRRADEPFR